MKKWRIPLVVSLACAVVWWTHRVLTDLFPPFDCAADIVLWVVGSGLKLATIVCIPFALSWVFARCQGDLRRSGRAVAVWGIGLIALLIVLSALRVPLAHMLNNNVSRFFPTVMPRHAVVHDFGDRMEEEVANWQSGRTFAKEFSLIVVFVALLGAFAFTSRGRKIAWAVGAALVLWFVMIAISISLGLFVGDYDFFFSGTLMGPLTEDIIFPFVATDPSTEIGCLFYLVLIWSSWLLDAFVLRDAELPQPANALA